MPLAARSFDTFMVYAIIPDDMRNTGEAETLLFNIINDTWEGYVDNLEVKRLRHKVIYEDQLELDLPEPKMPWET